MSALPTTDLCITQGETGKWLVACVDTASGAVIDLTGCSMRMAIHRTQPAPAVADDSAAALVLTSPDGGIQITNTAEGAAQIIISDTQSLEFVRPTYVYSLKLTNAAGEKYVITRGALKVTPQITHDS